MADPFIRDEAYEQRITDVILRALMVDLMDPATRQVIWRTGEITNVLTHLISILVADSQVTDTPTQTREFCADWSKRLYRRIAEAKRQFAAGGKPFESIRMEGDLN